MKPFTIFPLISLLFFFATWIFSADVAPQAQQPAIPDSIVDESCNTDSPLLPQHTVVADVNYLQKMVSVEQRITYQNMTNTDLANIVLNVDANRWVDTFFIRELLVDDAPVSYTLDEKRLFVTLPNTLGAGCSLSLLLKFDLAVPQIGGGLITDSKGYFGYTERQLNLGHWLPTVAVYRDNVWITQPAYYIGEQEVIAPANWMVTVNLINPPENLQIAAAGIETRINATTLRYDHLNSRDFTLSMSDKFNVAVEFLPDGTQIELYTFTDLAPEGNSPILPEEITVHALRSAVQSFEMFADLFGTYPYARLVIVQGDFPDGMEFSGLAFVGDRWFVRYHGDPASYLTLITVHEVSHQWWYARVGNDPAMTPWLDEALATYSEYVFLEEYYPDLREWWWEFRVNQYTLEGFVDATIYDFPNVRAYINAVYLRGVKMLHEIRGKLGKEEFFDLLALYAQTEQGQIATPQDFWALMTPDQLANTEEIRSRYLRVP
ncbi:MAG: M1 family metallopeptidase [bacterium]|nr:M1 family metallopeptidase [bacterium]